MYIVAQNVGSVPHYRRGKLGESLYFHNCSETTVSISSSGHPVIWFTEENLPPLNMTYYYPLTFLTTIATSISQHCELWGIEK